MESDHSLAELLDQINSLSSRIRSLINENWIVNQTMRDPASWYKLTSSLDVLGDSTLSIEDYLDSEFPDSTGLKYLYTYGLLQAQILQQNSASHIADSLNIKLNPDDRLKQVRDLRNDAVGHPTDRGNGSSFHYISRNTMAKWEFHLLSSFKSKNKKSKWHVVDLLELTCEQELAIINQLKQIILELETRLMDWGKKYSSTPLARNLEQVNYSLHCIVQGIEIRPIQAGYGLSSLREFYESRIEELKERFEWNESSGWTEEFDQALHIVRRIEESMANSQDPNVEKDLHTFVTALRTIHKDIEEILFEIDERYQTWADHEIEP